jgi:hypothetical protein
MSSAPERSWYRLVFWSLLLGGTAVTLASHLPDPAAIGDDGFILAGIKAAAAKVPRDGYLPASRSLSYFSILAHVILGILLLPRLGDRFVYSAMVAVNCLSFLVMVEVGFDHLRRVRSAGAVPYFWVLCLVASPMVVYAFGVVIEPVVAALTLLFTVALLRGWPAAVTFGLGLLIGIGKETNPVLLLALIGIIHFSGPTIAPSACKHSAKAGVAGVLVAALADSAFNLARFDTWYNAFYARSEWVVHDPRTYLSFLGGIWLSPNAGILWHWPAFSVLMAVGIPAVMVTVREAGGGVPRPIRLLTLTLGFVIMITLGLARWYAPFGWLCWSNRLILPWMPSILLLMLTALSTGAAAEALEASLAGPRRLVVHATMFVLALPHVLLTQNPHLYIYVCRPTDAHPELPELLNMDYYYECMTNYIWFHYDSVLLIAGSILDSAPGIARVLWLFCLFVSALGASSPGAWETCSPRGQVT